MTIYTSEFKVWASEVQDSDWWICRRWCIVGWSAQLAGRLTESDQPQVTWSSCQYQLVPQQHICQYLPLVTQTSLLVSRDGWQRWRLFTLLLVYIMQWAVAVLGRALCHCYCSRQGPVSLLLLRALCHRYCSEPCVTATAPGTCSMLGGICIMYHNKMNMYSISSLIWIVRLLKN